jgi:hypothetical protein
VKLVGRGDDATLQLPPYDLFGDVLVCHTTMRYICDR